MLDVGWVLLFVVGGAVLVKLGQYWYRRRLAARQADQLLTEVVKGKDAFRR